MNISISNIAWDTELDNDVSIILNKYNIKSIDIAPPKYFPDPSQCSDEDIILVKEYWKSKGVSIIGMQSLLFGTEGLNVFSEYENQEKMLSHLKNICHIGNKLGATKLVFGSPRNRDRGLLNNEETQAVAIDFFNRLGEIAKTYNVFICLEPNPECYNSNFMIDSLETASIVEAVDHPNIKMQLDIGAMLINNEDPNTIIPKIYHLVEHIHISEPQLSIINIKNEYHNCVSSLILKYFSDKVITIEMLTSNKNSSLNEIENSIKFVVDTYIKMASV